MIDARKLVGTHDVLFITLDTLRYDVAVQALAAGMTPHLAKRLPGNRWEERHTPGSFTYAAHQAFFAGFLPTPACPGKHPRLFSAQFPGSETTSDSTLIFETPDIVSGFAALGYFTLCIGGVGFFNKRSPLGNVLPGLFQESHWSPEFGVTQPDSTERQVTLLRQRVAELSQDQRIFLFLNVSALHQPNCMYLPGALEDSAESQAAALAYVDAQLEPLFQFWEQRSPALIILCSDHGTAYGEEGYQGHRNGHPVVWTVPYAEWIFEPTEPAA